MKTLKFILFLTLIVFIGSSIYIAVQPNQFTFSRSRVITAPVSLLYNKVNNLKKWPQFSPWIEKDPDANLTYGKKTLGIDATYIWNGEALGEGRMKTLNIEKNKSIEQQISIIAPFKSESSIFWSFEPTETGTKVTWTMQGKQDFMSKLYTTFNGSIEKNTSPDFDRGLFKLDSIVSADMEKHHIKVNGITEYGGGFYMYKTTSVTGINMNKTKSKQQLEVKKYMIKNNISSIGMPFTIYNEIHSKNGNNIISSAIPVMTKIKVKNESDVLCDFIPNTKALKTTLKGDYKNLSKAWKTAFKYLEKNNIQLSNLKPFEVYINAPIDNPNPADWITEIYIPIKN